MTTQQLMPSFEVVRKLPLNFESMAAGKEKFIRTKEALGPISFHEVERAYVSAHGVVFRRGIVVRESVYGMFDPKRQWTGFIRKLARGKRILSTEPLIVGHHPFYDNYYHWLCEIMPRLFVIRDRLKSGTLLIPEKVPGFVKTYLDLLECGRIVTIRDDELIRAPKVSFPSHIARPLAYNENVMRELSSWLSEKLLDSSSGGAERLFITRKNARYRITYNEEKIEDYLVSKGFEVVRPEEYSVREQMNLFRNARIIIGSHGAGFANLVFAPRCQLIVDIIHKEHPQDCFYNLANVYGTQYYYFQCEGKGTLEFKNNDDVIADPDEFKRKIGPLIS